LRLATRTQTRGNSQRNCKKRSNLPKGVFRERSQYVARIQNRYLGRFCTPELANAAYFTAVKELYGEFARAA